MNYCRQCWSEIPAGRQRSARYCSTECRRGARRSAAFLRRIPSHVTPTVRRYLERVGG